MESPPRNLGYIAYGSTHPVGARPELRGRQNIVMTEWGPWDHESPLIRTVQDTGVPSATACTTFLRMRR